MPTLSYKYRLYPNRGQVSDLNGMLGAFCDLYNACLQQRIEAYQRRAISLNYYDQAAELRAIREADERLAGFSFTAQQQVMRRVEKTFKAFFGRVKKKKAKAGFPRFKARDRYHAAEFRVGDGLSVKKNGRIAITGVAGEIKVRRHRPLPAGAKLGQAILTRQAGHWYVVFQATFPEVYGPQPFRGDVGVDVGLASLAALTTGERVPAPQWTKRAAKSLRRHQRAVARCRRGSSNRRKAKQRLARFSARIANRRRDALHKLSRDLVNRFSHIAFEDLSITALARTMLAKSIHNAAWGQLISFTTYKAANAGGFVAKVNPRGTSQECACCGMIVAKTLKDRVHHCPRCGAVEDRDVNAARVIRRRAFSNLGPGAGLCEPSQRVAA